MLDTETTVYGFIQWTHAPIQLSDHAIVIFYSKNLETKKGELVGVYGNARILEKPKTAQYPQSPKFENDTYISNICAEKTLSILFPIRLDSSRYTEEKRLVPQVGYTYKDENFAAQVIDDEIQALKKSGRQQEEFEKLTEIYRYITGNQYPDNDLTDEIEQEFIIREANRRHDRERYLEFISQHSLNSKEKGSDIITLCGKQYKRDNVIIGKIKYLRGEKCQICGYSFMQRNGRPYTEAAHIKAKSEKGDETPDNILILCPNHHKEFDLGKREILEHTKDHITFTLNEVLHTIELNLK